MIKERTWVIEDHICRHCSGGRILRCVTGNGITGGGNPIYKCADCGASVASMHPSDLCWCGFHFKNQHHITAYQCHPFSILQDKPYLLQGFLGCGCDPKRGEVGVISEAEYRRLEEIAEKARV